MRGDPSDERIDPRLARAIESHTPPTTSRPDWDDVVRRSPATDATERRSGRPSRVIWLAAAAAAIAVVTLTAVVRNTSTSPVGTAAPPIAPARVDWGMTATLRVKPDPGVPMAEARNGLIAALRARAGQRDIAGFEATAVSDGTIGIRVPAAEDRNQLMDLTAFERIAVIDPEASIVATDNSLKRLGRIAADHPASDGSVRYWLGSAMNRLYAPAGFPTVAAARKARTRPPNDPVTPIAIPSTLTAASFVADGVVADGINVTYALVNRQRLATSAEMESLRIDGDRVIATLSPSALGRLRSARSLALATTEIDGGLSITEGSIHLEGDTLVLDLPTPFAAETLVHSNGQPGVEATVDVSSVARYGSPPDEVGTPFTPPRSRDTPSPMDPVRAAPDATWTKTDLTVDDATFGPAVFAVGTRADGPPAAVLMQQRTGAVVILTSSCERGLGAPVIQVCQLSRSMRPDPGPTFVTYLGRTATDVTGVTVRFPGGTTAEGSAKNGWFVIGVSVTRDDRSRDPEFIARTASGGVAFDGTPQSVRQPFSNVSLIRMHEMEERTLTKTSTLPTPGAATMTTSLSNP